MCMPIITVKERENSPLWLNDNILILREQKNRAHSLAKRLNTPELWADFRRIRNEYTDEIRTRVPFSKLPEKRLRLVIC